MGRISSRRCTVYVLFFYFALLSPLGGYAYEAMFPMTDANKITVWAFVLCGGAQVIIRVDRLDS